MTKVVLKTYKQILTMGKDAIHASLVPVRVNRAKQKAALEIAILDEELVRKETSIHELCTTEEIDFHAIIQAEDDYGLVERKRKALTRIVGELFP